MLVGEEMGVGETHYVSMSRNGANGGAQCFGAIADLMQFVD